MPEFYAFTHNSHHNSKFTWATSILSRSKMVDFQCPECGVKKNYPSGAFDIVVEGGWEYPDILGCGAYPFLIVAYAVVDDWQDAGISSFHTFPVEIAEVRSKPLRGVAQLKYLRVEIDGSCQIDLEESSFEIDSRCSECGHLFLKPTGIVGYKIVDDSWDGSPIFRDVDLFPRVNFCTELILELARKHRRTNFRFEPMEGPWDPSSRGIKYIDG